MARFILVVCAYPRLPSLGIVTNDGLASGISTLVESMYLDPQSLLIVTDVVFVCWQSQYVRIWNHRALTPH